MTKTENKAMNNMLLELSQAKNELLRQLIKVTEALELIGSITKEGMPLTLEDAKNVIKKYS